MQKISVSVGGRLRKSGGITPTLIVSTLLKTLLIFAQS